MTPPTPYPHAGETGSANTSQSSQGLCDCMEECPDCDSCAAPWVIIAVLEVNGHGIVKDSINHPSLVAAQGGRKWVKPISCLGALDDRYRQAEDRLAAAEQQTANITASSTAAPQVKKETEGNKPKA